MKAGLFWFRAGTLHHVFQRTPLLCPMSWLNAIWRWRPVLISDMSGDPVIFHSSQSPGLARSPPRPYLFATVQRISLRIRHHG